MWLMAKFELNRQSMCGFKIPLGPWKWNQIIKAIFQEDKVISTLFKEYLANERWKQ